MERPARRSARLLLLQHLLYYTTQGLTTRELAAKLGVTTRTVQRDIRTLESDVATPISQDGRRYSIARSYRLPPVSFALQEARSLLLAARLFLHYSDEADPHGIAALKRLATVLPPPVAEHVERTVDVLKTKPQRERFVAVMEAITNAWARRRLLRIRYYSRQRPETHEAEVEPYLLEATAPGHSTYLIGYSRTHKQVRTFKVERIEDAEILDEECLWQPDGGLESLLSRSWGIIWADEDDLEVELRFSAAVSNRVREAVWHPSQELRSVPDGGCVLTIQVPSLVEVLPWIRGWGPDVEVIRPQALRDLIAAEAAKIVAIYQKKDGGK